MIGGVLFSYNSLFLSTPSVRRATGKPLHPFWLDRVFLSTPSVRRATAAGGLMGGYPAHFYPRPPCGGRLFFFFHCFIPPEFLSTPSVRRATPDCSTGVLLAMQFLSTPSVRRATQWVRVEFQLRNISIHALRAEGDIIAEAQKAMLSIFLSTPSVRRATTFAPALQLPTAHFYPRPPCGGRHCGEKVSLDNLDFYPRPPCGGRL